MPKDRPRVDAGLSAFLDAIRVAAAVYVVIHHATVRYDIHGALATLFRFGQEAVIVFFLLSGFVIYVNEAWRNEDRRGYYVRRLLRLYPPLLCAMLVSALIAFDDGVGQNALDLRRLFGTLVLVQDIGGLKPGVIVDPYLDNGPLWSLSYEAVFYLLFPFVNAAFIKWPRRTNHGVGIACPVAFIVYLALPNHWALVASYFVIWWVGALCGRLYIEGRGALPGLGTAIAYLALLAMLAGANVARTGFTGIGIHPFLPFRHFATALMFAPTGILLSRIGARHVPRGTFPAIKWMASISYGLYIFHYPILANWYRARTLAGFAVAVVLLVLCAYLFDRRLSMLLRPRTGPRVA